MKIAQFFGLFEDPPDIVGKLSERPSPSGRFFTSAGNATDADFRDLSRITPRSGAVDFRVFFPHVPDEQELAVREGSQNRSDRTPFAAFPADNQLQNTRVAKRDGPQVKRTGWKTIATHEFRKRVIKLPRAGRNVVKNGLLIRPFSIKVGHPGDFFERAKERIGQQLAAVRDVA